MDLRRLGEVKKGYTYFEERDVLFAKITPCTENGKGAIAEGLVNKRAMGSTEFFVFRAIDEKDVLFVYHLTMSRAFRKRAQAWMQGSAGHRRVPKDFFAKRPIIIPDAESRKRIGETLEDLQKRKQHLRKNIVSIRATSAAYLETVLKKSEACNV